MIEKIRKAIYLYGRENKEKGVYQFLLLFLKKILK